MKFIKKKEIWMSGFALFSLFFGAGNLILPPSLGVKSGGEWFWIILGFAITAVVIPILGVLAHARVQGTLYDLAKKVSPWFSSLYCFLIYLIAITLPAPRTASVTHEMAIKPLFGTSSWLTSGIYFFLTFLFVINRSKILSFIGKFLTPIIILILVVIIAISVLNPSNTISQSLFEMPFISGVLEGYQTFDAIGGVVVGAVVIISLNLRGYTSYNQKKEIITKSGLIAGGGLLLIYGGLIYTGSTLGKIFSEQATRTEILSEISNLTLGSFGTSFLSVLVALACFTTCVGVVTGAADYIKGITNNSKKAYVITAFVSCLAGVILGSYSVKFIIDVAIPALMFIYPLTIVIILLNVVSKNWSSVLVFRAVIIVAFIFSIPDFLQFFISKESLIPIQNMIPFSKQSLGWVLPSIIAFFASNLYHFTIEKATTK